MSKTKKFFLNILAIIVLLIIYGFYSQYSFNKPSKLFESHLYHEGDVEEYEFYVGKKNYIIGFAVNSKKIRFTDRLDGNYTIEYFKDNKLIKKEIINKYSISKYYKNLWNISGSSSFSSWKQKTLGQIKQKGDIKIRVTVIKPESQLKEFKGKFYFFADYEVYRQMQKANQSYTPQMRAKDRLESKRRAFRKKFMDTNETNQSLLPLREALDTNNFQAVKNIIEDNNISVNSNMVLNRTALFYASFYNDVEIAKYLIDKGADIHHKDKLEKNALAYTIENNATKTAKLLLDSGVDVNEVLFVQNYLRYKLKDYSQIAIMSPLQYTVSNTLFEMSELLLQNKIVENDLTTYEGEVVTKTTMNKLDYLLFSHQYNRYSSGEQNLTIKYRIGLDSNDKERTLKILKKYNFEIKK